MDFSTTPHAHATRYVKSLTIAAWCWDNGLTPEAFMALTEPEWNALAHRAVGKPASEETRRLTYCHLSIKEAWCAGHPDHPSSQRTVRDIEEIAADLTRKAPK